MTALAVADFRDRVRRPAYAMILLAAVALGWLAAPAGDARWVVMYIGEHRGVYGPAYTGTLIALAGVLWLTLGGFYAVRGGIARDERSGVGQVFAATPMRTVRYLAGKFLSNCLVLGSMVAVLAATALIVQVARGEDRTFDPVALLTPFVVLALPMVAVTAAAALLFDTVPLLAAGLGNIAWFPVWLIVAIGGQGPGAPFGGIGVHAVAASMARSLGPSGGDFSLGLVYLDEPLRTFHWDGLDVTAGFLAGRLAVVALSVLLALAPALWFARFDPARRRPTAAPAASPTAAPGLPSAGRGFPAVASDWGGEVSFRSVPCEPGGGAAALAGPVPLPGLLSGPVAGPAVGPAAGLAVGVPRSVPRRGGAAGRLFAGEFRILVSGVSRWWWLGALLISVAGLVLPVGVVGRFVLPVAWLWPVLVWSRLGTRRHEHDVTGILGAYPFARRRVAAEWAAGVVLTALTGAAPLLRMIVAADRPGVLAWCAGALIIPSVALALGMLSRTPRLFQAAYLLWWYAMINGLAFLDVMRPGGPSPYLIAGVAVALLAAALVVPS